MNIYLTFILILFNNIYCQNSENNLSTSNNINTYCNTNIKFCLSCKADKCLLCDFNKQYFLNSNKDSCVKCEENKTNCLFTLECGTCQICQSGYSLCSGNCVKNKDNCLEGDFCNTRNCSICTQNYYLNEGSCTRVTTAISNCKTYENANVCKICEDDYNISTNKQECNAISSNSVTNTNISTTINNNCFVNLGNKFSCSSCKYRNNSIFYKFDILNPLKILEEKIINFTNSNILTTIQSYSSLNSLKGLIDKNKICIQRTITNCIEINNTINYTCLKCLPNHYLLNGVCTLYSENIGEGISGCQEYEQSGNNLICKLCEPNYNKINNQTCQKLRSIDGCLTYNSDRSSCVNCDNVKGYKVLNNSCARINNYRVIENCINYYESGTNEGKCQNCINGYNNVNFTSCILIEITNEKQNTSQSPIITIGSVVINSIKQCYPTITDCVYYNKYSGRCITCRNNKIPSSDGNCNTTAVSTQFCDIFDGTNCRSCVRDKFFIESTKRCEERTINNSDNLCKHNFPRLLTSFRVNGDGTNTSSNSPTFGFYDCQECVNTSFVIDTNNKKNCIPRLKPNSDDPFKDPECNGSQIRVRHNNSSNKILTCRSISGIIGNLYKNDINCYTYKSSLDNFTDFKTENTLCAICKSGFSIQNKRCTVIENCVTDSSKFGGCSRCNNENLVVDLTGDTCVTKINNCKIMVGQFCIQCQDHYYGFLSENISSIVNRTGQGAYLGFEGEQLKIDLRDNNQVKISKYRWFYYTQNNKIKFTICTDSGNLFANNILITGDSPENRLSGIDVLRVFAVNPSTRHAALCRKGNYMKYINNYYKCSPIQFQGNEIIPNVIYNNFLNSVISRDCGTNHNLVFRNGMGPFCSIKANAYNDQKDPIELNQNFIDYCRLHYYVRSRGPRSTITRIYCMFCGGNRYVNKSGNSCDNYTNATTDIVVYCLNFTDGVCTSCPAGMTVINNACVNSAQLLWTGGKTIANFKSENNCGLVSWNQNLEGNRTAFILIGNNDSLIAKCETCMSNDYIMNYESFTCIKKNNYNFSDCLSTGLGIGCVNCLNGKISFAATVVHELCVNTPPNGEFIANSKDNCLIYELNSQQNYQCYECQIGFMKSNGVCNRGVSYCSFHNSISNCRICQDGYYLNSQRNQCIKGNIKNCKTYTSENVCSWCENNYTLYGDSNEAICIDATPIHNILSNCDQVRSVFGTKDLYCYCNGGTIPLTNTPYTKQITLRSYIENCITYNTSDISICAQCKSDLLHNGSYRNNLYILESNSCVSRTPIDNCYVYTNNANRCLTCNKGYYFNSNGECQINPISNNCKYVLFNRNCLLCKINYYLNENNECILVSSNKIIENCYKYNNNQDCVVCIRGYLYNSENSSCMALSDTIFLDNNNNNCKFDLVNGYPNNSCQCNNVDYYFNSESKMCVQINNCLKINNGLCTQCSTRMFYNEENSTCTSVTNIIENCDLYSNKDNCIKCNNGFGLKNNLCERIDNSDIIGNCSNYSPNSKCLLCMPGNYISNGNCLPLTNNKIFISSSSNKEIALVCKSGSQMNKLRECISTDITSASSSTVDSSSYSLLFTYIIYSTYIMLN